MVLAYKNSPRSTAVKGFAPEIDGEVEPKKRQRTGKKQPKPKIEIQKAIEDEFDLANIVCVEQNDLSMWAYLNSEGDRKQFVYGWELEPLHETQISSDAYDAIMAGFKEIPKFEQFTIVCQSFAEDGERQKHLKNLAKNSPIDASRFFIYGEQARVRELTARGSRKTKRMYVFFTYTVDPVTADTVDRLESILAKGKDLWDRHMARKGAELDYDNIQNLLKGAFESWLEKCQLLSSKMNLMLKPMNGDQLWGYLWRQFYGEKEAIPLPHWLVLDQRGLREEYYRDQDNPNACSVQVGEEVHMTSRLISSPAVVPTPDREWIWLPGRKCFAGILTFDEPPDGWANEDDRFSWLWDEVISKEKAVDLEVVTQISWVNPKDNLAALQRFTRQQKGATKSAEDKRSVNKLAEIQAQEAEDAQESLMRGDVSVYVGIAIVVYAKDKEKLKTSCRFIKNRFRLPAVVLREQEYAWRIWLQTLPLRWEGLYAKPYDLRIKLRASDALGFCQFVGTRSRSKKGPEFIAERGGAPINVSLEDNLGSPRHGIVLGKTGSGKSVMVALFILNAIAEGMQVTIVDFPKGNGKSTYTWLVNFLGGAEFDTGKNSNNILELVDVRSLAPKVQAERLQSFYKNAITVVLSLILDNNRGGEQLPVTTIESLVTIAVTRFYNDPEIQARCANAREGGLGSSAWEDWPTLTDLYTFFTMERLDLLDFGRDEERAMNYIRLRLRYWLDSPLGNAIAKPSAFDDRSPITMFSLKDLSSDEEAGLLGLSAQTAAMRRALSSDRSFFYVDEASVLLQFSELAKSVGMLMATGRAAGLSVLLSTQDPNILEECSASSKIRQNLSFILSGRVNKGAIASFERLFEYPRDIIVPNSEDNFVPSREGAYSRWLVDDDGLKTPCRYYAPYNLLGITVNNPPEVKRRDRFFEEYSDKYEAIGRYAAALMQDNKGEGAK